MTKVKDYIDSIVKDQVESKMKALAKDTVTTVETVTETQKSKDRTLANKFYTAIATNDPMAKAEINKAVKDEYASKGQTEGTIGSGTAGGVLVPTTVADSIIAQRVYVSPMRQIARIIPNMPAQLQLPSESGTVSGYWVSEASSITASAETFAPNLLTPYKLAGLDTFTAELLQDAATNPSVQQFVEQRFALKLMVAENAAFTNGTGSGQPYGFRSSYITPASVAQAGAGLTYKDVVNLQYTIPTAYRNVAVFVTSGAGMQALMNVKDTQGRPIWANSMDGMANGAPGTILGRPVYVIDEIPANLGTGTNETEIWYMVPENYVIGDRLGLTVDYGTQGSDFASDQISLRVVKRVAGMPIDQNAFAKLTKVVSA